MEGQLSFSGDLADVLSSGRASTSNPSKSQFGAKFHKWVIELDYDRGYFAYHSLVRFLVIRDYNILVVGAVGNQTM